MCPTCIPTSPTSTAAKVATFTEALDDPDGGANATEAIRSLIGGVVLRPGCPKRGQVEAELRGELMGILNFTGSPTNPPEREVRTNAEAGPRNQISRDRGTPRAKAPGSLPRSEPYVYRSLWSVSARRPTRMFSSRRYRGSDNHARCDHANRSQEEEPEANARGHVCLFCQHMDRALKDPCNEYRDR